MKQLVQVWTGSKLYEIFGFLFFRCWKVWLILFAIEGFFSVKSDQSVLRRVVLRDPIKEEMQRSAQEFKCKWDQKELLDSNK